VPFGWGTPAATIAVPKVEIEGWLAKSPTEIVKEMLKTNPIAASSWQELDGQNEPGLVWYEQSRGFARFMKAYGAELSHLYQAMDEMERMTRKWLMLQYSSLHSSPNTTTSITVKENDSTTKTNSVSVNDNDDDADVTFVVENRRIKGHKLLLAHQLKCIHESTKQAPTWV
jgi:hypothetical protein